jgi:hypothetical protein
MKVRAVSFPSLIANFFPLTDLSSRCNEKVVCRSHSLHRILVPLRCEPKFPKSCALLILFASGTHLNFLTYHGALLWQEDSSLEKTLSMLAQGFSTPFKTADARLTGRGLGTEASLYQAGPRGEAGIEYFQLRGAQMQEQPMRLDDDAFSSELQREAGWSGLGGGGDTEDVDDVIVSVVQDFPSDGAPLPLTNSGEEDTEFSTNPGLRRFRADSLNYRRH